jgi:hypothetical protein
MPAGAVSKRASAAPVEDETQLVGSLGRLAICIF